MLKMCYIKVKLTPKLLTLALRKPQLIMQKDSVSFFRLKGPFSSALEATILTSFMIISKMTSLILDIFEMNLSRGRPVQQVRAPHPHAPT